MLANTLTSRIAAAAALLGSTCLAAAADKPVIALSNSYYGNTWRHQMVESFQAAADQAKKDGLIADVIVLNGDGSAAQQNSQIAELVLKRVSVIAIDAASETGLNSTIEKACKAGIKVLTFDATASAPCNHKLDFDFTGYQKDETQKVLDKIGNKGNIIVVRGVKGNVPDKLMFAAQQEVLDGKPDVKVVATVYGEATSSVTQSALANVLPSLPHVDAVLGQGGSDDIGIAQAFEQFGGPYRDKMPVIEGGGSSNFIKWWAQQKSKTGYSTVSMNVTPGVGGAAFWVAYALATGATVPATMTMPVATVTDDDLKDYVGLPDNVIVSPTYGQDWVKQHLLAQ